MRIILPIRRFTNGSAAMNRLLAYARGFACKGAEVWLFFFITNGREEKLAVDDPRIHVVHIWEKDGLFFRKHRLLELMKNLIMFGRNIKKGDVLFLYGRANYFYIMAFFLLRRCKVYCEITEHPDYNGNDVFHRVDVGMSYFFLRHFNGLFVISNSLRNHFLLKGISEEKVHVINMFVDRSRFDLARKNGVCKYIAYCGSVSCHKDGVDILLKSFSQFFSSHPNYYLYVIGGEGDDKPLKFFKDLAKQLNVDRNVIFTGQVPFDKMPEFLINAKILALSRPDSLQARNGFPTKLGEYLATGVPVVVTDVGEISSFIKNGINGIIAKPSDVSDFADKLSWVADHPQKAKEIGLKGRELVEYEFSSEVQSEIAMSIMRMK